ncbi:hypothetical protein [Microbacterium sp. NIBRBAC000506063]|uniref:hypothetical protein n=1 Tax=Microbacterium sp. NIBRBAC000506063 TaxID=2734618 RepID=UPI001BB501CC|nr:hypothetical protein [Microbacterium sp. NIBRBAC000506063]QTV79020.1 hypothetical protein KAE78_07585 [Microbacterium sp. NIBRBAC000506063]
MTSTDREKLPSTVVPPGLTDPVESARAELKAALAAIEKRANIPRRVEKSLARGAERLRRTNEENPALVIVGVLGAAAAIGGAVWLIVRGLSK